MKPFTFLVALSTVLTSCRGADYIRGLAIRQTNTTAAGGFATRAPTCSANQIDCGGGVTEEICCPTGTFCFNSDDGVCCPTADTDCTDRLFAAPTCADPSWYLCTDYQPNIPGYVPNDPGYWCCPTGTQCLVSAEAGFVCRSPVSGDVPGSTVLSGQAPTQASTATTAPTLAPSTHASGATTAPTVTPTTQAGSGQASNPSTSATTSSPAKNSAFRTSSLLSVPTSQLGSFVAQVLFGLAVTFLT